METFLIIMKNIANDCFLNQNQTNTFPKIPKYSLPPPPKLLTCIFQEASMGLKGLKRPSRAF